MPSGRPSIGGAYDAAPPAGKARARSLTRVDLVEEIVPLGDRELAVLRPRAPEELIDEHAFEEDEFLPYWAELWPSGVALAKAVAPRALKGARVLELGCGLGLPSIAAARAGGRVLAADSCAPGGRPLAMEPARHGAALRAPVDGLCVPGPHPAPAPVEPVLPA